MKDTYKRESVDRIVDVIMSDEKLFDHIVANVLSRLPPESRTDPNWCQRVIDYTIEQTFDDVNIMDLIRDIKTQVHKTAKRKKQPRQHPQQQQRPKQQSIAKEDTAVADSAVITPTFSASEPQAVSMASPHRKVKAMNKQKKPSMTVQEQLRKNRLRSAAGDANRRGNNSGGETLRTVTIEDRRLSDGVASVATVDSNASTERMGKSPSKLYTQDSSSTFRDFRSASSLGSAFEDDDLFREEQDRELSPLNGINQTKFNDTIRDPTLLQTVLHDEGIAAANAASQEEESEEKSFGSRKEKAPEQNQSHLDDYDAHNGRTTASDHHSSNDCTQEDEEDQAAEWEKQVLLDMAQYKDLVEMKASTSMNSNSDSSKGSGSPDRGSTDDVHGNCKATVPSKSQLSPTHSGHQNGEAEWKEQPPQSQGNINGFSSSSRSRDSARDSSDDDGDEDDDGIEINDIDNDEDANLVDQLESPNTSQNKSFSFDSNAHATAAGNGGEGGVDGEYNDAAADNDDDDGDDNNNDGIDYFSHTAPMSPAVTSLSSSATAGTVTAVAGQSATTTTTAAGTSTATSMQPLYFDQARFDADVDYNSTDLSEEAKLRRQQKQQQQQQQSSNGSSSGNGSRSRSVSFVDNIVTDVRYRERVNATDKDDMFYTHYEETQFMRQQGIETQRAEALGMTWMEYMESRSEEQARAEDDDAAAYLVDPDDDEEDSYGDEEFRYTGDFEEDEDDDDNTEQPQQQPQEQRSLFQGGTKKGDIEVVFTDDLSVPSNGTDELYDF